jgi:tetratricopeptide (TPR) repeat protein
MAPSADEHLASALREYNSKVDDMERSGTKEELLDALVNRGIVLSMMDSYVSAILDFDDAVEIINEIENGGVKVDAGVFVKTFVSRGEIYAGDDGRYMADDYAVAASRLPELNENSRYFDRKKIINMCLDCCEDLIGEGFNTELFPFADKAHSLLIAKEDDWSRNRYVEVLNFKGQAMMDIADDEAMEYFSDSIDVGRELLEKGRLDDMMSLVFPFVYRGDIEQRRGVLEPYFIDRKAAITLLEELLSINKLEDVGVLAKLHQDIANTYLTLDKVKEAEEHLMKEVMLNIDGTKEYVREFMDGRNG